MAIRLNQPQSKLIDFAELLFKVLLLLFGFLEICNVTYGTKILSLVLWPTVALGALLVLYRILRFRHYIGSCGILFMVAFGASFVLSMFMNRNYGQYENFTTLIIIALQFCVLYLYDAEKPSEYYRKQFHILAVIYNIGIAAMSIASFVQMAVGYNKVTPQEVGPQIVEGFIWGRLFGVYWDPNIGSVMACVAIVISLYYAMHKNSKKIFRVLFGFNAVLQFVYIVFSDSRTGRLCLMTSFLVFVFTRLLYSNNIKKIKIAWKRTVSVVAITIVAVTVVAVLPVGIKYTYNVAISSISSSAPEEKPDDTNDLKLDRSQDYSEDITNRRSSIWKSGFEIFKTTPVYGTSYRCIVAYAKDHTPNTYILTNDYMVFSSMHNLYMDILVGQGVIGLLIFLALGAWIALYIFRNLRYVLPKDKNFFMLMLTCVVAAVTCTVVITELIYVKSPTSTMFWVVLGYMSHYVSTHAPKKNKQSENQKEIPVNAQNQ